MKKWVTSYFWIVALTLISAPLMAQETEYHFGVRWSVNGVPSSLRIHNIMLNFSGTPSHLDTRLPISQYIKNGKNKINLNSWPLEYEPDSELKVSLLYWQPGKNPNTEASTAFEVVMMPGEDNADPEVVFIDPGAPLQPLQNDIRFNRYEEYDTLEVNFNNRQSMPTWCWEEGDVLSDSNATRDSLAREYRRLYALFEAQDNDALMDASKTMIEELALASGESEAYVRQRASFTMFFDNPGLFQLRDFPEEPMTLNLAADNRVAWLTTKGVNVPIRFMHVQEDDVSSKVRLYFIRRDGQWEICR
ncbi:MULTISPECIES: hypothetical protein [Halomonadaceae]|uniref:DUF3828 domain-containing protein n=1 Tax=Vreelandella titanicae TaxID=664683 RepID=A0AAP9T1D5_9GAMM|nr:MULTISPECIES: hypothetical protein [Halomonas]QKS25699.1 hypothetical protein FX987_03495 [Halomonas titanicae]CDG53100.1 exported hypothetical protein [Halomonas sp. A3H3]SDI67591.1 hypothetical protein SAMN04487867_11138 [Halomonas titanicae]|tara:strand:+ start:1888 stop:2799 length:912 start_codon:yes stop_codon:yes gene_type:complete